LELRSEIPVYTDTSQTDARNYNCDKHEQKVFRQSWFAEDSDYDFTSKMPERHATFGKF